jgi:hypothetical protein
MLCPSCKLENPPEAQRCDCGYCFDAKATAPLAQVFTAATGQAKSLRGLLLAILIVLCLSLALQLLPGSVMRPKWEYQIISAPDTGLEKTLRAAGEDGWEVASARRALSQDKEGIYEFVMKRRK